MKKINSFYNGIVIEKFYIKVYHPESWQPKTSYISTYTSCFITLVVQRIVRTKNMERGVSSSVAAYRAVTLSRGIVHVPRASSGYTVNSRVLMERKYY